MIRQIWSNLPTSSSGLALGAGIVELFCLYVAVVATV